MAVRGTLPVGLMLAQLGDDAGHDVEAGGLTGSSCRYFAAADAATIARGPLPHYD